MVLKDWKKKVVYNLNGNKRYEYTKGEFTIDIREDRKQGYPGSNMVNVYGGAFYGGNLLGTPKTFSTKTQVNKFVRFAMKEINNKRYGKKTPFLA